MRMGPSMAWICPLQPAQNDPAFHRPSSSVAYDFKRRCPSPPRVAHCRPGPGSPAAAAFDLGLGDRRFSAASAARPTCSRARVPTGSAARRGLPWALECNAFGVLRGSA